MKLLSREIASAVYAVMKCDVPYISINDIQREEGGGVYLELGGALLRSLNASDCAGIQRDVARELKNQTKKEKRKIEIKKVDSVKGLKEVLGLQDKAEEKARDTNVALVTNSSEYEQRCHVLYAWGQGDKEWDRLVKNVSKRNNVRVYTYDPGRGIEVRDAFIALLQAL